MKAKDLLIGAVLVGGSVGFFLAKLPPELTMSADELAHMHAVEASVHYSGCNQAWAAGVAPIYRGQPGYRDGMDGDSDGIACEPYYGR